MYISNGNFLGKISQKDFGELLSQLDRRKRKNKIELVERDGIKKYAAEAKGNFEVTTPYENEQSYRGFVKVLSGIKRSCGWRGRKIWLGSEIF